MAEHAEATWSDQMSILTLALDLERIWNRPFDKENFSLIIHETAHELAAHHGNSFANALEECAGAACKILIDKQKEINNFISNI
jgi:Mlc titration factor MtfA (ptsG expression regulator)